MQRSIITLVSIVLGLLLIGCQQVTQPTATPGTAGGTTPAATATKAPATSTPAAKIQRGGTIRFGQMTSPTDFDPTMTALRGETRVWNNIYNHLVELDAQQKLAPELAESWEVSPDGKAITFKLRKGVKFHDGTDFKADAVKFLLDRHAANPKRQLAASRLITPYDSSQIVDDYTVKVNLKQPWAPFLYELSEHGGAIISPTAAQKAGDDYTRNPVGTGAFKFVDFTVDVRTTLTKFDGYWKKGEDGQSLPYADGIVFRPIPDDNVRLVNLRTGELDIVEDIPPKDIGAVKSSRDLVFAEVASMGHRRLSFMNDHPPFDNQALRQAVAYAIDKKAILKAIEFDTGVTAETLVSPSSALYDPNVKSLPYDPAKAKEKMREGGKPDGFTFNAVAPNQPVYVQLAEAIQSQLARVGIAMKIEVLETGAVITKQQNAESDAFVFYYGGLADPATIVVNLLPMRLKMGTSFRWENQKFIDLFYEQAAAYDLAKRKSIWSEMMKIAGEEVPSIYITHPSKNLAAKQQAKNLRSQVQVVVDLENVWMAK